MEGNLASPFSMSAVNQKVDPCPALSSTPISPFIKATSSLEMASPSPVPP